MTTLRAAVQHQIDVETALIRLGAAVEPVYFEMAYDEAKRRAQLMGLPAGIESVCQDVISGRWRPSTPWGP